MVNGWSRLVRAEAGQETVPHPQPPRELTTLQDSGEGGVDAQLAEIADGLHSIFDAEPPQRLAALNGTIRRLGPTPELSPDGIRWLVSDPGARLEASLVLALDEHARDDPTPQRLGTCGAHACVDAYHDRSQAGTRRYCSVTCQNRAKVAAHRQRHGR